MDQEDAKLQEVQKIVFPGATEPQYNCLLSKLSLEDVWAGNSFGPSTLISRNFAAP